MKLLVIVLCLLSERFLIHKISYKRFSWFSQYYQSIQQLLDEKRISNPTLRLLLTVLPIFLLVTFIYWLLHNCFWGVLGFLINLAVFYYCLGPHNVFYPITNNDSSEELVAGYLVKANEQLFSVIIWYLIAGPIAALLYRLISLCRDYAPIGQQATQITNVLEWLPARVTVLLYLLVGNFQAGVRQYVGFIFTKPELNNQMIQECGLLALDRIDTETVVTLPIAERIVEHATIVLLVFIALFIMVART